MIRGTTPTLEFNLPFKASLIKSAQILISYVDNHKEVVIEKTLEDCVLGETSIGTELTQEETLAFPAPITAEVQLRVVTSGEGGKDVAMATEVYKVKVKKLLKDGVLE